MTTLLVIRKEMVQKCVLYGCSNTKDEKKGISIQYNTIPVLISLSFFLSCLFEIARAPVPTISSKFKALVLVNKKEIYCMLF